LPSGWTGVAGLLRRAPASGSLVGEIVEPVVGLGGYRQTPRMANPPARARVTLTGISSRTWEHPADRGALVALRKLKGFDTILKAMSGLVSERAVRLAVLGSAVRVDERQFARVHRLLVDVATVLDVPELPEVYVANDPVANAVTIGMDKPFIVLNSALVDLLDDDELAFVIAHELGHVMSGHAVYQTLLQRLLQLSLTFASVPVGGLGIRMIVAALLEWSRKAELSADRAGLLGVQDPAVALRVHMQMASGGHVADLDPTSFLGQGAEYVGAGDLRDSVLKLLLLESRTHPFAVVRAAELRAWVDAGDYTQVLGGSYPRRSDDDDATISAAAKEAAQSYAESFRQTQDTLGRLVHDAAGWLGSAKLWWDERFRREE
jgi:Zn-dependent protease with chaperone function